MGCGSFRGPGGMQAHFASESQLDIICRDLGLDPLEFRRRNGVKAGSLSAAGVPLRQVGMQAALEAAAQRAATDVREQLLHLAATRLEARPEDMTLEDGRVFVKGSPDRGFGLGDLAVYAQTLGPGPILGRGAFASRMPQSLHGYGTQIVEVEVV